jgi:hypothetical protein
MAAGDQHISLRTHGTGEDVPKQQQILSFISCQSFFQQDP